jgi:hypothetical protein
MPSCYRALFIVLAVPASDAPVTTLPAPAQGPARTAGAGEIRGVGAWPVRWPGADGRRTGRVGCPSSGGPRGAGPGRMG